MLRLATVLVLLLVGWCIWERRLSWRAICADRVATFTLYEAVAALILFRSQTIADTATALGVPHLHSVIGTILVFSMVAGQIYSAACRLVPDELVRVFMHRVDVPAAIAAQVMLLLYSASSAPHVRGGSDLLSVPNDRWLDAYWLVYSGITLYMAVFLGWLMTHLQRDPRASRAPRLMLIASCCIGSASVVCIAGVVSGVDTDDPMRCCTMAGFAFGAVANAQSWRNRARTAQPVSR